MIRIILWSEHAEKELQRVEGSDVFDLRSMVLNGTAQLWECRKGKSGGYIVTWVDERLSGREWVWAAAAGTGFMHFAPIFLEVARQNGLQVRAHVNSYAMARLYRRLKSFRVSELVLRSL